MSIIADIKRLDGTIDSFEDFLEAINSVNTDETIILRDNVTVASTINVTKKFILDLNGFEINASLGSSVFTIRVGGNLRVKDTSSTKSGAIVNTRGNGIYLVNIEDVNTKPTLTFESGKIQSQEFGVCIFGSCLVNVTGGTIIAKDNGALASNGSSQYSAYPYEVNISGGTLIAHTESAGYANCGIYHANSGVVNVSGGNIVGTDGAGIVVRAGSLNVIGGTIEGQGSSSGQKMGDANPTYCGGIEICNAANYPGGMKTSIISGGQITSKHNSGVLVIGNPADYEHASNSKAIVSGGTVNGATKSINYVTKEGQDIADVSSSNVSVLGGTFNSDISQYVYKGIDIVPKIDEDGNVYYVVEEGLDSVVKYLSDILDNEHNYDAETVSLLQQVLQSLQNVSGLNYETAIPLSVIDAITNGTWDGSITPSIDIGDLLNDMSINLTNQTEDIQNIATTDESILQNVTDIKTSNESLLTTTADLKTGLDRVEDHIDSISTDVDTISLDVDELEDYASGIKSNTDEIKTTVSSIQTTADGIKATSDEIKTTSAGIKSDSSSIKTSAQSATNKLSDVLSNQERIATLQRSIAESVAKIAGDEIIDDDIRPKNPEEMEMFSFKYAVLNAERTGQDSIVWVYPLSDQIKAAVEEKGYKVALILAARADDLCEIKIK